jgi:hypothetical protein
LKPETPLLNAATADKTVTVACHNHEHEDDSDITRRKLNFENKARAFAAAIRMI